MPDHPERRDAIRRKVTSPRRPLLTTHQCAEILGVSDRTVRRYVASGLLRAARIGPRYVRIEFDELDRFISRHIPTGRR